MNENEKSISKTLFAVTILGNNSAIPAFNRHPTAQIVTIADQQILIDCGEGTQMQIAKYKIRKSKIHHILISHLHGDHYYGLIGIITSMGLLGRKDDLHLHAPAALKEIIDLHLKVSATTLPYQLHFHPIEQEGVIVNAHKFTVEAFAVKHRVECWGFRITEKKEPRKLVKEKALAFNIPVAYFNELKKGLDYTGKDGKVVKNDEVTIAATAAKSYAYSADTIYDESLIEKLQHADLLYHETTYLKDLEERAAARFHSTTIQAATIAKKAQVKKLIIGHFSSKYEDLQPFLDEAQTVFKHTELALEGSTYLV